MKRRQAKEQIKIHLCFLLCVGLVFLSSCTDHGGDSVVVYTALDRNFSEPIFLRFTEQTGIQVRPKYDTESTKTVGLVQAILAESKRPRCDVFWNNEIINTIRLKEKGLLDQIQPSHIRKYPSNVVDVDQTWVGFAARARVILVNTNLLNETSIPRSLVDLTHSNLFARVGIAKPLFGTTATQAAALFSTWGRDEAIQWFTDLKENGVRIESGNKACAVKVAKGDLACALTDTDDAVIELRRGAPVKLIYPDVNDEIPGTLFIPNTLALIKGCPHPEAGRKLINFLLSLEVEVMLASSASAQIPLHKDAVGGHPLDPIPDQWMKVDFEEAAKSFEDAAQWLQTRFLAP